MQKLESFFLEEREKLQNKLFETNNTLYGRISYIVEQIAKIFSKNYLHWSYDSIYSLDDANFDSCLSEDKINFLLKFNNETDYRFYILDKNNNRLDLHYYIPTRWLYEDFEEELKNGRQNYLDSLEKTKEEKQKKKEEDKVRKEKIKKSIKSKLSEEELKYLSSKIKFEPLK